MAQVEELDVAKIAVGVDKCVQYGENENSFAYSTDVWALGLPTGRARSEAPPHTTTHTVHNPKPFPPKVSRLWCRRSI